MDYKEKYKQGLECIQEILSGAGVSIKTSILRKRLQPFFPEPAESEDEQTKNDIISYLQNEKNVKRYISNVEFDKWIAWLEEQKKVDIDDKIEPKFHPGDWIITSENKVLQITSIEGTSYAFNNTSHYWEIYYCDKKCRLWTIADAKDGDVLYSLDSKQPFIFKHRKTNEQAEVYCGINVYGKFFVRNTQDCIITTDRYIPATKEQRDLLFRKMKEAGCEWDTEKKELKKIEHTVWSEEDEQIILSIEQVMNCASLLNIVSEKIDKIKSWLKSLKQKIRE